MTNQRDYTNPDVPGVLPDFVVGGLVAHSINHLLRDDQTGCCPRCCAPCGSLLWLRDNAPIRTSRVVAAAAGWGWDWMDEDDAIRWDVISARWERADQIGCHG